MTSDPVLGALPEQLGRYRLVKMLAAGGMSTVYRAEHAGAAGSTKTVVIKRMHPHLADNRELVATFLDQVRITSCIHHANVVATSELVSEGGELFTLGKAELRLPFFSAFDLGIFFEAGNLWLNPANHELFDLRYVAGTGLRSRDGHE